jgi:hypothetical protein
MNSASLCNLAGRYDNPIPPRFLAPIDSLKIPALYSRLQAATCKGYVCYGCQLQEIPCKKMSVIGAGRLSVTGSWYKKTSIIGSTPAGRMSGMAVTLQPGCQLWEVSSRKDVNYRQYNTGRRSVKGGNIKGKMSVIGSTL